MDLETVALDEQGMIGAAYRRRRDGALFAGTGSGGLASTGLRQPYWDYVTLGRGAHGVSVESFPARIDGAYRSSISYWARPARGIRSNISGKLIGSYGETAFYGQDLQDIAPDFDEGRRSLWSYAVDARHHRALAVVLAPFGGGELQIRRKEGSRTVPCLGASAVPNPTDKPPVVTRALLELGAGEAALPARLYRGKGKSRDLIVWMHGGPDVTVAYEEGLDQVEDLVGLGFDVLVPEYRGTRGNDPRIARALGALGRQALEGDIAQVEGWVRSAQYDFVALYGISFGGTFSWLAADSDAFDRHVLVAPLLKWRGLQLLPPDNGDPERLGRRKFVATNFDNVFGNLFGASELSATPLLEEGRATCKYRVPFMAVFGEFDDRAKVEDLGACQHSPMIEVVVLHGKRHESAGKFSFERIKPFLIDRSR